MNKLIALPCYNRPEYLVQCLSHLMKCDGIKEYEIFVSIDPSDKLNTIINLLETAKKNLNLRYYINNVKIGCNANIEQVLTWCMREPVNSVVYVEDDICLAPDTLRMFEFMEKEYYHDSDVYAGCAYSRANPNEHEYFEIEKRKSFMPWGVIFFNGERWARTKYLWFDLYNPPVIIKREKDGKPVEEVYEYLSWDYFTKWTIRGDKSCVFPKLSRSKNIGEVGCHTPSREWHKKKHTLDKWAGDGYITIEGEFHTGSKVLEHGIQGQRI